MANNVSITPVFEEEPEPELVVAEQQVRSGGTLTMSMVVSILNHALYLQ